MALPQRKAIEHKAIEHKAIEHKASGARGAWKKVARITSNNFSCGTFCMYSLSDITATPKQLVGATSATYCDR